MDSGTDCSGVPIGQPPQPWESVTNHVDGFLAAILIVDDEAPIRFTLRRFLELKGYEVLEAGDGVEALEVMGARQADMAILDLMMPRMNGVELLDRMKAEFPATRVVVISAYSDVKDISVPDSNVVAVLKKPFELRNLEKAVELALHQGNGAPTV